MSNLTIPIFGNQIFSTIISEIKTLSMFEFTNINDLTSIKKATDVNQLVIIFKNKTNSKEYSELVRSNLPIIVITNSKINKEEFSNEFVDYLSMPFKILDFKNKIVSLLAKYQFKKNSLIYIKDYILDKNERKIKKGSLELQLSEKEVDFLILFTREKDPISKNYVLKKVWNYSSKSETHTVETHIHRLRKKILEIFNDDNFIKNNNRGYYI